MHDFVCHMQELEQQMLDKIRAKQEREKQILEALATFAASQSEKTEKKMESSADNREAYLKALRDRLQEKSKHVEEVKTAKKERKIAAVRPPKSQIFSNEDTPVNLGAN